MKKIIALISALVLVLCLFAGCGNNDSTPTSSPASVGNNEPAGDAYPEITLTYSNCRAENDYMNDYNEWLFTELKNQANINIEAYYSNTLVGATTPFSEVKDGVADIAVINAGIEPDHFDIAAKMMYFMWGCSDNVILRDAWTKAFESIPEWQEQYEGTVVLCLNNAGNQAVVTVEQVDSIDDFQGMIIRGAPSQTSLIEALGAENLSVASTEVLANMEKGTIDGAMGVGTITAFSLLEFCKSVVYLDVVSGYEPQMIMNEGAWNKLTPEQQEVVIKLFDELSVKFAGSFDTWNESSINAGIEAGMTLNVLSDEDLARLQSMAYELAMTGIEELNALGYDGQAFYDTCRAALEECCAAAGYEITEIG